MNQTEQLVVFQPAIPLTRSEISSAIYIQAFILICTTIGIGLVSLANAGVASAFWAVYISLAFSSLMIIVSISGPYNHIVRKIIFDDATRELRVELCYYNFAVRTAVIPYSELVFGCCYQPRRIILNPDNVDFDMVYLVRTNRIFIVVREGINNWSKQDIDTLLEKLSMVGTIHSGVSYKAHKMYGRKKTAG